MDKDNTDDSLFIQSISRSIHNSLLRLGNGDLNKGALLLWSLAHRLDHARKKHKWGKEQETQSAQEAISALKSEIREWEFANWDYMIFTGHEYELRVYDEVLDILAVAIRIANREFEN